MSNRRRTPAEIANIVAQYHASGLSRRDFARRHDFSIGSLARWLQRKTIAPDVPKFVRVVTATAPTPPAWFELALPDGRRLRIPAGCDEVALRSLLGVLSEC
jgi:transposase-like protein